MERMVKRPIAILNLAEELAPELTAYFAQKNIDIISAAEVTGSNNWTHILTKNLSDFNHISKVYGTIENDIKIVSLTPVDDLQQFVVCNGKLILDEVWMRNGLGAFILDKFFQEYGGIAIGDNYPTFKEKGSFIITNPFNTGEYLDRLVYDAFSDGMNGLSVKTFFDHLVMYLTGLKTKGKLGLPIEVTYGYFEEVFGVQLHFFTKNLILEDFSSSLSTHISRTAEKYLLNIAVQSSDFFDLTLLRDVNKTVITGLWTKDERIKIENRGLLFNEISAAAPITQYPTEGVTSFQVTNPTLEDLSDKIILPATSEEAESAQTIRGMTDKDNYSQKVSGQASEDETSQTIKGHKSEEEQVAETIKGHKAEEEVAEIIKGLHDEDEIINLIKGRIEEEEQVFRLSGTKGFDLDKFALKVSSGLEDKAKGEDVFRIKQLSNTLPDAIKSSFNDFTSRLNKTPESLTDEDLRNFKNNEIPKLLKRSANEVSGAPNKSEKIQELKIVSLSTENENLKSKIKTLMAEVRIIKDSKDQIRDINNKAMQAAEDVELNSDINSDTGLREEFLQKLRDHKTLTEHDATKLKELLEKENKFLEDAKSGEMKLKKLQIENTQKDSFFTQELEKLQRQIRAKDLIVLKTKESFSKLVAQKDNDIKNLHDKINQLNKLYADNQSQNQATQIRELERQIVNHEKMIEIYKNKVTQRPDTKTGDDSSKDEARRLQMMNNQMKNQLDSAKKELVKYQQRLSQDTSVMNSLKSDKMKLEQLVKKLTLDVKKEEINPVNKQQEQEIERLKAQHQSVEAHLKEAQARQKDLEAKLQDALRLQKKEVVTEDVTKGKTAHLENNVRKLTQDLVESRNQMAEMKKETNKLRQEKTALQNQLDKVKKEADKAKLALPKKSGPGQAGGKAA